MPKKEYQARKAAGLCVRPGCNRKPKLGEDGTPRSYCPYHNELNLKNTAAYNKRQKAH
jgi:hypothetical protein